MTAPELKYGRRNVAKMIREWDALRQAIRAEGTPLVQSALDQVEEHIDYAYRADLAAVQPAQVTLDDQERNYLHLHNAAFDVWLWFETARPDLIGPRAEKLRDAVMGPRPFGCVEPQPDPRDEVIKGLVDALTNMLEIRAVWTDPHNDTDCKHARAALAAAKAVQND